MIELRCSCGEVFHADERHVGRQLACRCGRVLAVRRTPNLPYAAAVAAAGGAGAKRKRWRTDRVRSSSPPRVVRTRRSWTLAAFRDAAAPWLGWLCWGYLAAAAAAWLVLWTLSDRWWPATAFLFGPRWILLLPLAVLVPAAALLSPRLLAPLAAAALILVIPVVGVRVGWAPGQGAFDPARDLRVVTFNAAGREGAARDLELLLEEWRPDVVAIQECGSAFTNTLTTPGWHGHQSGELCLLSRHRIRDARSMDRSHLEAVREHGLGGTSQAVLYVIDTPQGPVHLANLHLETARKGLEGLFDSDPGRVTQNAALREIESRQIRRWIDQVDSPLIVAGDFNMPVESVIYRRTWGGLQNAFSVAGIGLGATRDNGWIQIRIDHILAGDGWRARRAFVGPDTDSDHRPLVADLRWQGQRRSGGGAT